MEDTTERGRLERAAEKVGRVAKLAGPTMGILAVSLFDVQHGASLAAELEHSDLDFMEVPVEMESSRWRMGERNDGCWSSHRISNQGVRVDSNWKPKSKQNLDELRTHLKFSQNMGIESFSKRVDVSAGWYDFMNSFGDIHACFIAFDKNSYEGTVVEAALRELPGINNSMWFEKDNVVTVRVTCNTADDQDALIKYCTGKSDNFEGSQSALLKQRQRSSAKTSIYPIATHGSYVGIIMQALMLSVKDGKFAFEVACKDSRDMPRPQRDFQMVKSADGCTGQVLFDSFDDAARFFMSYHKGVQKKLSTSASRLFTPNSGCRTSQNSSANCTLKFLLSYDRAWLPISLIHICKAFGEVEDACVRNTKWKRRDERSTGNVTSLRAAEPKGDYDIWVRFKNPGDAQKALEDIKAKIPKEALKQVAFAHFAYHDAKEVKQRTRVADSQLVEESQNGATAAAGLQSNRPAVAESSRAPLTLSYAAMLKSESVKCERSPKELTMINSQTERQA